MTWSLRLFQTTPGDFYTTAYKSWVQRWWLYLIYLGNTFDHHCDWQFPFEWKGCQQLWLSFLLLFNQDIYNFCFIAQATGDLPSSGLSPSSSLFLGQVGGGQHCLLSICDYCLSWTNTTSEQKIPIINLNLNRGPCLVGGRREKAFSS